MSPAIIVLIVVVVLLVLGGGGCLVCFGLAASQSASNPPPAVTAPVVTTTPPSLSTTDVPQGDLVRDATAREIEVKLRAKGLPAQLVMCPRTHIGTFYCDLTSDAGDHASVRVRPAAGGGYDWDVPSSAFLEGTKLNTLFQSSVAGKTTDALRVPCFTGILMKKVGEEFSCPVLANGSPAGSVSVLVEDADGKVKLNYTLTKTTNIKPTGTHHTVDFKCPPGKPPNGVVRAGCLCGDLILGDACRGGPGVFTDVQPTATGCRFTCD
jgi:hypothetical protein